MSLVLGGIALAIAAIALIGRYHMAARARCSAAWDVLMVAARRVSISRAEIARGEGRSDEVGCAGEVRVSEDEVRVR